MSDEIFHTLDVGSPSGLRASLLIPVEYANFFGSNRVEEEWRMGCDEKLRVLYRSPAFFTRFRQEPRMLAAGRVRSVVRASGLQ